MRCSSLKGLKVAIVSHVFATGPSQELEDYLGGKVDTLMFIGHPLSYVKEDARSFYKIYKNGKLIKVRKTVVWKLPELFMYFKDFVYTIIWANRTKERFDMYFGVDPLNAFAGILLKKIGKVKKVILYTIDYSPKRFDNRLINWIYHCIDSFCVRRSHRVWNLSEIMVDERKKKGIPKSCRQMVVPIGVFSGIKQLSIEKINRKHMVFLGHLKEGLGMELVIEALPTVVKKIPDVKLIVIGMGHIENKLKKRVSELGLSKYVEFKGFIKNHRDVEKILAKCAIGLAIYDPQTNRFTQYTDPAKPKQYMACGLPVIITGVPRIAKEIERGSMGIKINYNKSELVDAMIRLLSDDRLYRTCRRNAIEFASKYSWDRIFSDAFSRC